MKMKQQLGQHVCAHAVTEMTTHTHGWKLHFGLQCSHLRSSKYLLLPPRSWRLERGLTRAQQRHDAGAPSVLHLPENNSWSWWVPAVRAAQIQKALCVRVWQPPWRSARLPLQQRCPCSRGPHLPHRGLRVPHPRHRHCRHGGRGLPPLLARPLPDLSLPRRACL